MEMFIVFAAGVIVGVLIGTYFLALYLAAQLGLIS